MDSEQSDNDVVPEIKRGVPIFTGVVQLLIGGFAFLTVLILAAITAATANMTDGFDQRQLYLAVPVYLGIAAFFILMGIGSLKIRTWARNIMLIVSWFTLIMGILVIVFAALVMPNLINQMLGQVGGIEGAFLRLVIFMVDFTLFFIFIAIPGMFVILYSLKSVKQSFALADPDSNWTDRVPLPILAITLFMWITAASSLLQVLIGTLFPFFGFLLPRLSSRVLWFAFAALSFYLGLLVYWRRLSGWAGSVAFLLFNFASNVITGVTYGFIEMGALMSQQSLIYDFDVSYLERSITIFLVISFTLYIGFFAYTGSYFFPDRKAGSDG
jgi:hypothetical protein